MRETEGRLPTSDGAALAWRRTEGRGPTILWLGGFRSDMTGTKAGRLAEWGHREGRDFLRFDYFGHGASDGEFRQGTIGRWRSDALAMIDQIIDRPAVLVGSSMGGWLACLAALARPEKVKALVLVAPAADFTDKLMWPQFPDFIRQRIQRDGVWMQPSIHDPAGFPITRELIEDGARWSVLNGPLAIDRPVRILHGGRDADVPWAHGLRLAEAITSDDVVFSLVKDGDHSLSRPPDLARLISAVDELSAA